MSATLHTALFSAYFGGCPIITVPGFTHPVEDFFLEVTPPARLMGLHGRWQGFCGRLRLLLPGRHKGLLCLDLGMLSSHALSGSAAKFAWSKTSANF